MNPDNLLALKDDMIAFIEGHGMRHFPAEIPDDIPRVWWNDPGDDEANRASTPHQQSPESWKDFVEMAKIAGAPMVCIGEDTVDRPTLDMLAAELEEMSDAEEQPGHRQSGREMERVHSLFLHAGKIGHIELAFAHQGILFVHETATDWYRTYREMVDTVDHLRGLIENALGEMDEGQE
ncbi:MAG: hypothetical protein WA708_01385 [Acidobacteriaceae bacterium]